MRYKKVTKQKANGVVYTPEPLADFLAMQMYIALQNVDTERKVISILDPASGDGQLLCSMINVLQEAQPDALLVVDGYEIDSMVANQSEKLLKRLYPKVKVEIHNKDFFDEVTVIGKKYDYVISNPPYIRTQLISEDRKHYLQRVLGLNGRLDIYYAFVCAIRYVLKDSGVAGCITSNKFLSIKSGAVLRQYILNNYKLIGITDFGDTKLFDASVLPCVSVFSLGKTTNPTEVQFVSVYEQNRDCKGQKNNEERLCSSVFDKISEGGLCRLCDGRVFWIERGYLGTVNNAGAWCVKSENSQAWLKTIETNTWLLFSDIGKIRVGIKTTADRVFISDKWEKNLELLRPLITHHVAGQVKARSSSGWQVLYPHAIINGKKCAVNLNDYPLSKEYLIENYEVLSQRKYVIDANRNWYEIWVPQNPAVWSKPKIVFRDISEHPEFWLDETGAIVNGDCYWIEINDNLQKDVIYLALAVSNSKFIERYYDEVFNTKLYSGKRRFMSQYVERFPIPFLSAPGAQETIKEVKKILFHSHSGNIQKSLDRINELVPLMFGLE